VCIINGEVCYGKLIKITYDNSVLYIYVNIYDAFNLTFENQPKTDDLFMHADYFVEKKICPTQITGEFITYPLDEKYEYIITSTHKSI
jgi:hypothetical protein